MKRTFSKLKKLFKLNKRNSRPDDTDILFNDPFEEDNVSVISDIVQEKSVEQFFVEDIPRIKPDSFSTVKTFYDRGFTTVSMVKMNGKIMAMKKSLIGENMTREQLNNELRILSMVTQDGSSAFLQLRAVCTSPISALILTDFVGSGQTLNSAVADNIYRELNPTSLQSSKLFTIVAKVGGQIMAMKKTLIGENMTREQLNNKLHIL
uniref:Uncharacterized protein LOC102805318 n=1 Tax=Saccoglossus kowalevskii TaxID=10224 RepID=A0ABM0MG67_SACKO